MWVGGGGGMSVSGEMTANHHLLEAVRLTMPKG